MQGTLLNTLTFPELVDLVRKEFLYVNKMVVPASRQLFIYTPVANGNGNTKRFDEIDIETFADLKRQAEKTKKASVGIGYHVIATKKRVAKEIDITQEMLDENRYSEVGTLITQLAHFVPQRIELDGTHIFTFCNATSYTDRDGESRNVATGDGLSLINSAKLLKFSPITYSNRVPGDPLISQGGLELAEELGVTNILSNFGERRVIDFNTVITGDDPNTVNSTAKLLKANSDPDQSNPGVPNVYASKYRHVILPYLATHADGSHDPTKRRWWFLASIGKGMAGWQAYYVEWEAAHLKSAPIDDTSANHDYSADVWTFGTRGGYDHVAVTGRGIIGSLPTST